MHDFFISYNQHDQDWAVWIAWELEAAGHSVVIQAWDVRAGDNFVLKMHAAAHTSRRTIAVLSETYLKSLYTQPEWTAAFVGDPTSVGRVLLPVRVRECQPTGLLTSIVYLDLVGLAPAEARTK